MVVMETSRREPAAVSCYLHGRARVSEKIGRSLKRHSSQGVCCLSTRMTNGTPPRRIPGMLFVYTRYFVCLDMCFVFLVKKCLVLFCFVLCFVSQVSVFCCMWCALRIKYAWHCNRPICLKQRCCTPPCVRCVS